MQWQWYMHSICGHLYTRIHSTVPTIFLYTFKSWPYILYVLILTIYLFLMKTSYRINMYCIKTKIHRKTNNGVFSFFCSSLPNWKPSKSSSSSSFTGGPRAFKNSFKPDDLDSVSTLEWISVTDLWLCVFFNFSFLSFFSLMILSICTWYWVFLFFFFFFF